MTIDTVNRNQKTISDQDRKLALKQEPDSRAELTEHQAQAMLSRCTSAVTRWADSSIVAAQEIARVVDSRVAETLGIGDIKTFIGGVAGVGRQWVCNLYRAGCSMRALPPGALRSARSVTQLQPLYRMILSDQADRIPEAWELAGQIRAEDDHTFDGREKRVPKQINAGHVRKAVTNLLGPAKARGGKSSSDKAAPQHVAAVVDDELPPNTEPTKDTEPRPSQAPGRGGWVRDLWQAAAAWVDRLNEYRDTPPDLRAAIEHVYELAWKLLHEPEPDKKKNPLWTQDIPTPDLAQGGLGPVTPQKKSTGKQRAHPGTSLASSRATQVLPSRS